RQAGPHCASAAHRPSAWSAKTSSDALVDGERRRIRVLDRDLGSSSKLGVDNDSVRKLIASISYPDE
ncbi:MAG: hypothetical protein ACREJR_08545, partial [Candidatus Rokuibacteriota bacterium]